MYKLPFILLLFISFTFKAQQWEWAVTADSVYGNQETVMICKSNNAIYALISQYGSSIINNSHLDSGSVIVKISTSGQILWAKHYPGSLKSLYSENGGTIYFIGSFKGNLNFPDTTIVSHGGNDIFYGELDPSGNKLWVSSAGGTLDDVGNAIIRDSQGNLFIAGQMKDDYFVGSQSLMGKSGIYTYLLRCDLNGNFMASYGDSAASFRNTGLKFQKDGAGTIFLSTFHESYPCNYVCEENIIRKIDPQNYFSSSAATFSIFEYLHSWVLNNDSSITANYNTQSHYGNSNTLFNVSKTNAKTYRKSMGNGYDGKSTPNIENGIGYEIITGGTFFPRWGGTIDTLRFDSFTVVPDTLPNIMVSGIDLNNNYTWLVRSGGRTRSSMCGLVSDQQGLCYIAGSFNIHTFNIYPPRPLILGNFVLPAENTKSKFFVTGLSTYNTVNIKNQDSLSGISLFPNPAGDKLFVKFPQPSSTISIRIYNTTSAVFLQNTITNAHGVCSIDLAGFTAGVYAIEILTENTTHREKFIVVK